MVISTPRMIGRGTATLVLVLGLVVGVILGVLAPNHFGSARNDKSDHGLRGIATSIDSDVRSAPSAGEVNKGVTPAGLAAPTTPHRRTTPAGEEWNEAERPETEAEPGFYDGWGPNEDDNNRGLMGDDLAGWRKTFQVTDDYDADLVFPEDLEEQMLLMRRSFDVEDHMYLEIYSFDLERNGDARRARGATQEDMYSMSYSFDLERNGDARRARGAAQEYMYSMSYSFDLERNGDVRRARGAAQEDMYSMSYSFDLERNGDARRARGAAQEDMYSMSYSFDLERNGDARKARGAAPEDMYSMSYSFDLEGSHNTMYSMNYITPVI